MAGLLGDGPGRPRSRPTQPPAARRRPGPACPVPSRPPEPDRDYTVRARRRRAPLRGHVLTDPWGLVYELADRPPLTLRRRPTLERRLEDQRGPVRPSPSRSCCAARRASGCRITLVNEVLLPARRDDEIAGRRPADGDPRFYADRRRPVRGRAESAAVRPRDATRRCCRSTRTGAGCRPASRCIPRCCATTWSPTTAPTWAATTTARSRRSRSAATGSTARAAGSCMRDDHGDHVDRNWREYWWYADPLLAPAGVAGQVC